MITLEQLERGAMISDAIMHNLFAQLPLDRQLKALGVVWGRIESDIRRDMIIIGVTGAIVSDYDDSAARLDAKAPEHEDVDALAEVTARG